MINGICSCRTSPAYTTASPASSREAGQLHTPMSPTGLKTLLSCSSQSGSNAIVAMSGTEELSITRSAIRSVGQIH
jgi:hypothetical protein